MTALLKQPPIALGVLLGVGLAVWTYFLLNYLLNRSVPEFQREDHCFAEAEDGYLESELEARLRKFCETVELEAFCRSGPQRAVPSELISWSVRTDPRNQ
jgi:hypothetical protein